MNSEPLKPIQILLVEDNPADVHLTREALKDCNGRTHLSVVGDGIDAMAFLRRTGNHLNAHCPDLILLDLNLPLMNGYEVLSRIKTDSNFKQIPVVVFSGSKACEDVVKCYKLHANAYVSKPINFDQFNEAVARIQEFWLLIAARSQ